ncbi:hypothetical protein NPX13_g7925 [Xylaria arbuscula]|uniref:Tafazzin family protein n=1 Tax=Xylaria arbuscula TaxID=114810 RepID=A0A9W8N9K0_9PEZI|nr:hypothetical protein NPX13_g7925 [Xylaria arbuscula]
MNGDLLCDMVVENPNAAEVVKLQRVVEGLGYLISIDIHNVVVKDTLTLALTSAPPTKSPQARNLLSSNGPNSFLITSVYIRSQLGPSHRPPAISRHSRRPQRHRQEAEGSSYRLLAAFFSAGQVLPTHRLQHSPHGGLFQPTVPQAIKLLSSQPFTQPATSGDDAEDAAISTSVLPPIYARDRHSWVHVFPEACVHQHPKMFMRYFKWGVSRMILESEPMPDVLPIFIDGTQKMMSEDREWPRFLPRFGFTFRVAFGEPVDTQKIFGDLRARWQELVRREREQSKSQIPQPLGELSDELKYGDEATKLRIEVARRVRDEVLKVRASLSYPNDEPSGFELAETWRREPGTDKFKSNVDDSLVNKRQ